jgi:dihydroorotate dehydrogenase
LFNKPWLLLPVKVAHDIAPVGLKIGATFQSALHGDEIPIWKPLKWKGLSFPNRFGVAGGVDKDGELIEEWWAYGAGFVEIGTVTPRAQGPNPGKIMGRDLESKALWNRMGFPGSGVHVAKENLKDLPLRRKTPVFVNIGKNRDTANDDAVKDYAECMRSLSVAPTARPGLGRSSRANETAVGVSLADAYVINISSPNTTGLRELLQPKAFQRFLGGVMAAKNKIESDFESSTPVLLKLSPDTESDDLQNVVRISCELGIDGFVATNTTLAREHGSPFPPEGGVSGQPLARKSKEVLSQISNALGHSKGDKLLISVGGVMSAEDVRERLELGADLVQAYSGLIFEGPGLFRNVARAMRVP